MPTRLWTSSTMANSGPVDLRLNRSGYFEAITIVSGESPLLLLTTLNSSGEQIGTAPLPPYAGPSPFISYLGSENDSAFYVVDSAAPGYGSGSSVVRLVNTAIPVTSILQQNTRSPVALPFVAVDNTTPVITILSAPTHGKLSGNWPFISYEPGADYSGLDQIQFKVVQPNVPEFTGTLILTVVMPHFVSIDPSGNISVTGSGAPKIEWSADLHRWTHLRGWTTTNVFNLDVRAADRFLRARY